ncbi:curved DNA-binding protein [mine drainage metagenome]|uniref:Curved DNA-binding protein n=1 Tax=mine drainage metagenome TaxID=410659 RepID=A0A1J5Q1W2_9ZZZZ
MHDEKGLYPPSDPRGYYAALEVGPLADLAEIKAAYRQKAKYLHPDRNPTADAAEEFMRISEAWRVLRDADRRALYDRVATLPALVRQIDPDAPDPQPLCCARCGRPSAQPRYILFPQVKSFLLKTRRQIKQGIFCRDCADRMAIHASTLTWLQGWWGLTGPWLSLRALISNLKGGIRPRQDNLRVLLYQARAFLAKGDYDLAHALAKQARAFARFPEERARVERLLAQSPPSGRKLKDRWAHGGYAAFIQAFPFVAVLAAIAITTAVVTLHPTTDEVGAAILIQPARAGESRHVAVDLLKVRQAPGDTQPVVALLDRFTPVQVTDTADGGEWARIKTPGGLTGYVPARFLFGGSAHLQKDRWCGEHKGPDPENGDVLSRRTGGEHRLDVTNESSDDVVVRLKTPNGHTVLSFFVGADSTATIDGIPDGVFRVAFATGETFSRACGIYLDNMRAFMVPNAQSFEARPNQNNDLHLALTIPDIGPGPDQAHPFPLDRFLNN